jgi:GNAT superfamily N-acetyltransferase
MWLEMKQQINVTVTRSMCTMRTPELRDYDKIADLAGQLGYPSTRDQVRTRLDQMAKSAQSAAYVAELPDGQIVGWIGLHIFLSVEQDSCAEISGLIVDQQTRSREIGKVLLGVAEEWARSQDCDAISVHTNVTRKRAHRFYERNGYEHIKNQKYLRKRL